MMRLAAKLVHLFLEKPLSKNENGHNHYSLKSISNSLKKKIKIGGIVILTGILILASVLFLPRQYDVDPFQERKGTKYWELKTGSTIGYFKIESFGSDKKSPIIYLHGGPGGRVHDKAIEALRPLSSQGHDLYFYDQAGSGHSQRLTNIEEYSVERHQKDLKEIVSIIGADKVILIGHSWGALLAINYLEDYEETVEKLVLTGPGPILPINTAIINEIPPDSLSLTEPEYSNKEGNQKAYNWRSRLIEKWAYLFGTKLASDKEADDFFTYLNQELSKSTVCTVKGPQKYEGGGGFYSHIMTVKSFRDVENRRERLKKSNIPLLILRGQCDNQKWGFTKEYLDLFPNSRLTIIKDVGHDIVSTKADEYITLIKEFIDE